MKKITKNILALLLAAILMLTPMVAFAAGELGAEDNPYEIKVSNIDARPTKFQIPAGSSVWVKAANVNSTLTIGYATNGDYKVEYNGHTYYPDTEADNSLYFYISNASNVFKITNTSTETTVNVSMLLASGGYVDPTGTIDKPEEVTLTPNIFGAIGATATKELAINNQGYHFMTTAQSDGIISVSVSAFDNLEDYNSIGWSYRVTNKTQGTSGETHYSDDEEPVYHEEIEVAEGDEVIVAVSTYDPSRPNGNPKGVVSVEFTFAALGSMNFPEEVELAPNFIGNLTAIATKHLAAGNNGYHFMTVAPADGKLSALISAVDNEIDNNPIGWSYSVVNKTQSYSGDVHRSNEEEPVFYEECDVKAGDEVIVMVSTFDPEKPFSTPEGSVSVQFNFFPVGSSNAPEKIKEVGYRQTSLLANNEGYHYEFTATEDCKVTVGIDTEATSKWQYSVNVLRLDENENSYGDTHWSDDEVIVAHETHELKAGEKIRVWVATYNGTFRNPKGTVSWYIHVEALKTVTPGDIDGNERINISDMLLMRKYVAGITELESEEALDLDGNGKVNIADVLLLRKYLAGIISSFPVEE